MASGPLTHKSVWAPRMCTIVHLNVPSLTSGNHYFQIQSATVHNDLKIDPVLNFTKITSKKFFEKLPQIPNELLHLPPHDPAIPNSRKRPREMLDYTYENFPSVKIRRHVSTVDENLDP
ncbi:hypothetical protein AVEN_136175-1 [Araneus ventricosus]|uniref:Uncharacterized protein n=1 Tax=Araneus ventricosus TaxID=182803 RepID=A0A4Y2WZT8_ARAVE|nr:hypothetical protein AVEN_29660-1 [Araneus ventricosus]GBO42921.1 hypothetical protein AVEN_136175-1 [Araneus ventricosus]